MQQVGNSFHHSVFYALTERAPKLKKLHSFYGLQPPMINRDRLSFITSIVLLIIGMILSIVAVYLLTTHSLVLSPYLSIASVSSLVVGQVSVLCSIYTVARQGFERIKLFKQANSFLIKHNQHFIPKEFLEQNFLSLILPSSYDSTQRRSYKFSHPLSPIRVYGSILLAIIGVGFVIGGVLFLTKGPFIGYETSSIASASFFAVGISLLSWGFSTLRIHAISSEAVSYLQLLHLESQILSDFSKKTKLEKEVDDARRQLAHLVLENNKLSIAKDSLERKVQSYEQKLQEDSSYETLEQSYLSKLLKNFTYYLSFSTPKENE